MNILAEQILFSNAKRRLERARRLYVFLCRNKIYQESNQAMIYVSRKMLEYGFYSAKSHERNVRQSIQSQLFRIEKRNGFGYGWHTFLKEKKHERMDRVF